MPDHSFPAVPSQHLKNNNVDSQNEDVAEHEPEQVMIVHAWVQIRQQRIVRLKFWKIWFIEEAPFLQAAPQVQPNIENGCSLASSSAPRKRTVVGHRKRSGISDHHHYLPAIKASREVANLTWGKNLHTPLLQSASPPLTTNSTTMIIFFYSTSFFLLRQISSTATQPTMQTDTQSAAHTHTPTAIACTAHHLPTHPLNTWKIFTNPRPLPMPYNCVPFLDSQLLSLPTSSVFPKEILAAQFSQVNSYGMNF